MVRAYFSVVQLETELLMLMGYILLTEILLLVNKITRKDLVSSTCNWMKYNISNKNFSCT